jgi:hypothetical protein
LSLVEIERQLPRIAPKRVILTHMGEGMLAHLDQVPYKTAADGMTVEL